MMLPATLSRWLPSMRLALRCFAQVPVPIGRAWQSGQNAPWEIKQCNSPIKSAAKNSDVDINADRKSLETIAHTRNPTPASTNSHFSRNNHEEIRNLRTLK